MASLLKNSKQAAAMGWSAWLLTLSVGLTATSGCKDKQKCDEAVQTTRQAISVENMPLSRQWREYTWKVCEDTALQATLDQEILNKEKEIQTRADEAAKKARELGQTRLTDSQKLWKAFDELKSEEQTESALKKALNKAKRLTRGVEEPYLKQLQDYNSKAYKQRVKKLSEKAKK